MMGCIVALAQVPSCWMHHSHLLIALYICAAMHGPPELVLQQVQHLLLTLVSSISVQSIHSNHSMSCGDYEPYNFFQLTSQCMVVIEGSLIEDHLFMLSIA